LGECAGQLHSTAVYDGDLVAIGDEIGDGFTGGVEDLFVLKGDTA
jgi:hypothetical protein